MICTPDLFMHRWDLARATGQDETLMQASVPRWDVWGGGRDPGSEPTEAQLQLFDQVAADRPPG